MTDAETLARIVVEINVLLTDYVDPGNRARDANLTLEEIMSAIDLPGGMRAAENILRERSSRAD